jgi:hypothetical protein
LLRGKIVVEKSTFSGDLKDAQFEARKVPDDIGTRPALRCEDRALGALRIATKALAERLVAWDYDNIMIYCDNSARRSQTENGFRTHLRSRKKLRK